MQSEILDSYQFLRRGKMCQQLEMKRSQKKKKRSQKKTCI
jgi:hypothetical protein